MSTDSSSSQLVDHVVAEYMDRRQRGETPSIEEYCEKHPNHAGEIRSLLRTVERADVEFVDGLSRAGNEHGFSGETQLEQLAGYRVVREIGRGGMGIVYEAEHENLGRRAALKVLPRHVSQDTSSVKRFIREGKAIAKMHHSNIVPLYEVGEDEGRFFLAMQLIDGRSLDQVIRDIAEVTPEPNTSIHGSHAAALRLLPTFTRASTSLSESHSGSGTNAKRNRYYQQIARIGAQAAEALAYAHQRGFVHRDVKPSNLLLDNSGVTWLTDFGLAKSTEDEITHTGDLVGTLRYMAPERFKGTCDEKADIYGLGLTLYEFLTLSPAFSSSDRLSTIRKITNDEPVRLRTVSRQIPKDLETIVMKAIDKEPRARYASAKEMAEDLSNFANDLPIKARRLSVAEQFVRWSRKNKAVATALLVTITSLVALATVSTTSSIREKGLRISAENAKKESEAKSEQLQKNLYYAQTNLAIASANTVVGEETIRAHLQETHPDQVGQDYRGWEWYFLKSLINQEQFISSPQVDRTLEVDFSPDGSKLVNAISEWGFQIRNGFTGEILASKQTGSCSSVQWSPDGESIAHGDYRGDIHFWDAQTLERKSSILNKRNFPALGIRWSPDSKQVTSLNRSGVANVWDVDSGKLLKEFSGASQIEFGPHGQQIAVRDSKGVSIFDVQSYQHISTWNDGKNRKFTWGPDGQHLVTLEPLEFWNIESQRVTLSPSTLDDRLSIAGWRPGYKQLLFLDSLGFQLWDWQTQSVIQTFFGHAGAESVAWSKDGGRFATSGQGTVRIWNVDGSSPVWSEELQGENDSISWAADGNQLVTNTSMNAMHFFDSAKREMRFEQLTEEVDGHRIGAVAFHPNQALLAFGGQEKQVSVKNTETGTVRKFKCPGGEIKKLAWSSDGKLAATCWLPHFDANDRGVSKTTNNLVIWDRDGKLLGVRATHEGFGKGLAWHPEGHQIATAATDGFLRIWDPNSIELISESKMDPGHRFLENSELGWSPDSSRLASAHRNAVFVWDANTGAIIGKLDEIREDFCTLDWSPDSRMLAAGSHYSMGVWNADDLRLAIGLIDYGVTQVRWSPDGRRLACSAFQLVRILDASRGYELENKKTQPPLPE